MDLFLKPNEQKKEEPFRGDLERLCSGVSSSFSRLEEMLKNWSGLPLLAIVVGHPGTGKSTLVGALKSLSHPDTVGTFEVDRYIDWAKIVAHVDQQPDMDSSHYVPVANEAALTYLKDSMLKESMGGKKLVFVDGGGLLEDYERICKKLGFLRPVYIVLDASSNVLEKRLTSRGDSFHITEKEREEHQKNLKDHARFNGIVISTDNTSKENPQEELRGILEYIANSLSRRPE